MKPKSIFLLLIIVAQLVGCSEKSAEKAGPEHSEKEKEPESRVKQGPNGQILIKLDAATQKTMGLQVVTLISAKLPPSLKGYGKVLDAGALAAPVAELSAATAASQASQNELQRLKILAGQNNTSQRSLQTAEATAVRDQAQLEAIRLRLITNLGAELANRPDLPAFVQSLISLSNALVQINLPAGQVLDSPPSGARLLNLSTNAVPVDAKFIGTAPIIDPQLQSQGLLFLVSPNLSKLIPGAAVTGYITVPGEPENGVLLPRDALVRFGGKAWVYQQMSEDTFGRIEAPLQALLPDGWFVSQNLKPQDKVVTVGAQLLLSEELKGQTAE